MTRYVGLDLHKRAAQASLINEEGKRLESYRIACTQESLLAFARERLRPEDQNSLGGDHQYLGGRGVAAALCGQDRRMRCAPARSPRRKSRPTRSMPSR